MVGLSNNIATSSETWHFWCDTVYMLSGELCCVFESGESAKASKLYRWYGIH